MSVERRPGPSWDELRRLLRARREALGLYQVDLARQCAVAASYVSTWETGGREPMASNLLAWMGALGIDVVELVDRVAGNRDWDLVSTADIQEGIARRFAVLGARERRREALAREALAPAYGEGFTDVTDGHSDVDDGHVQDPGQPLQG